MSIQRQVLGFLVVPVALVALVAGCGSDASDGAVDASQVWARTSPAEATAGAAYMVLSSDQATSIVSASVPADIAARVELHETVSVDMEAMDDDSSGDEAEHGDTNGDDTEEMSHGGGAMTMQPVGSIEIPAGDEVALEPGGIHLMMLDLAEPLESGETFELTLKTADGEEIEVTVEVRDEAP